MGYGTFSAIKRLSNFLFITTIGLGIIFGRIYPITTLIISGSMILIGASSFIYGISNSQKYKDVFDYEPARFWGKDRNGKYAREVLLSISSIGIWCALTGAALFIIIVW
ncbi:MAG: hypothetical protein U0Z26_16395 [Anaerolineales bacterium]